MTLKASLSWLGDREFVARSTDGPAVVIDSADGVSGPKPLELLLMSVVSCSAVHVLAFLKERHCSVTDFCADISAERAQTLPKRLTKVSIKYVVSGMDIKPKEVAEAIRLSEQHYCSAIASLNACCTSRYEIVKKGRSV